MNIKARLGIHISSAVVTNPIAAAIVRIIHTRFLPLQMLRGIKKVRPDEETHLQKCISPLLPHNPQ
ncbi:hypothetical protein [uncultured Duncaniella sp.]|uniref:hypothetical protein n=1 Tax=uncultured Duncaniella sp. TaxID=2768039 RepID=UPI00321FE0FC